MPKHRLDPLMNPRSVAYVGASETPGAPGYQLIQVAIVEKLEINRTFPGEVFDIQDLRARYPSAPPAEPGDAPAGEPSEVQKTIQEFRKIYE